ncbi:hypothetical protein ACRS8P_05610 [Burkholderia cenocepacia]|uniref:hypothetical protein n=1 Tax=Burkholderia pseudomultivorans TaxID=1207504 RepID=UPI0012DB739D|nr:hypothetical protein [Burkholderia pseudomultivorans]
MQPLLFFYFPQINHNPRSVYFLGYLFDIDVYTALTPPIIDHPANPAGTFLRQLSRHHQRLPGLRMPPAPRNTVPRPAKPRLPGAFGHAKSRRTFGNEMLESLKVRK